jgi:hypothetical protein
MLASGAIDVHATALHGLRDRLHAVTPPPPPAAVVAYSSSMGAFARCNLVAERIENIVEKPQPRNRIMFFTFPEDARWNAERQAVEFGVEIGEYRAVVRVTRRVFQQLLPERPTPERCVETYYLQRTKFESIAERKLRRRQLSEDGNVEISGRDFREGSPSTSMGERL